MITTTLASVVVIAVLLSLISKFRGSGRGPLPPGPKGYPIIGNLLDMPTGKRWEAFARWGEQWGNITSVSFLGTTFIMINSLEVAKDLLEKRSGIYADRPEAPLSGGIVGWKNIMAFMHYGDTFKLGRRLMHGLVGTLASTKKLHSIHEAETHRLLKQILATPEKLEHLIMHSSGAIILRVMYGFNEEANKELTFVDNADKAVNDLYISTSGFLVDAMPILRFVPSWFPGGGFQTLAKGWAVTFNEMVDLPFAWIKEQLAMGSTEPSFVGNLLRENKEPEFVIKWTAASMSAAGPDTTAWTIYAFFKAMAMYPDVMKRGQAEIDSVIGKDRLPMLSDRPNLPFVDAMVMESLRWHPVAPLGFPHRMLEDDTYDGYFLPKGSLVQSNVWKFTRDPSVYPNPDLFDPTRFIASESSTGEVQQNPEFTFGWGRRHCPGKLMALEILFLAYARILAVFDVKKGMVNGKIAELDDGRSEGVVSRPLPFAYDIKPRDKQALDLIEDDITPIN